MEKQLVANCIHIPYHDRKALDLFGRFIMTIKPHEIHLLGDIMDCISVSTKFNPPTKDQRVERLSFEMGATRRFLQNLRSLAGNKCRLYYHGGNHEDRLRRWLDTKGRALCNMISMDSLGFKDFNITYYPYDTLVKRGRLGLTHGNLVRKASGATAKAMLEKYGQNILFGHTHRGGAYYQTNGQGTIAAWENFCLCRMDMPYMSGPTNWQQGWSLVYNDNKRRFQVVQVPVIKHRYIWEGVEYKWNKNLRLSEGIPRARI